MRLRPSAVALASMLLAACSPTAIDTKSFTDRDLSGASGYAWHSAGSVETGGTRRVNRVALSEMIRAELVRALEARGLTETPDAEADVLIGYRARFEDGREEGGRYHTSGDPFEVDRGGVSERSNKLPGAQPPRIRDYDEGTLTVTVYDPQNREPLWRGTADVLLPAALGEADRYRDLREVIDRLFAKFPAGR